ncbi:hypothetical protein ACFE04_023202 [Oxalis oulophora]
MTTTIKSSPISNPNPSSTKKSSLGGLRLNLHRLRSKSSSNSTLSSPRSPLPMKPKYSREDELKEVFRYFDSDGDEKISAVELRAYFGSIGEYMSTEEAQSAIDDLDSDGDKLLDFKDFLKLMKMNNNNSNIDHHIDEDLKNAFEMFEFEEKGCITPKGLKRMLNRLGDDKISLDDCVAMIRFFDIDGNGVLDFHEFHQMMA